MKLQGDCNITVADKMPSSPRWALAVKTSVLKAISSNQSQVSIDAESSLHLALKANDGTELSEEEVKRLEAEGPVYQQTAFFGPMRNGRPIDPVFIRVQSERPDRYLRDVLSDLRDATKQFSGSLPALIVCFIPEIESFSGLEKSSALKTMTIQFFEQHAPQFIHAVSYASDSRVDETAIGVQQSYLPSVLFYNHRANVTVPPDLIFN